MKDSPYKRGFVLTCPRCSTQTDNSFIGVCKNCRKGKILASENEVFGCAYCGVICSSPRLYRCRKCGAAMESLAVELTGASQLWTDGCFGCLILLGLIVGGVGAFGFHEKGFGVVFFVSAGAAAVSGFWRERRKFYVAPKKDRK
jgi:DNA-directed RNA polymerase subunit RPC12/RpoP